MYYVDILISFDGIKIIPENQDKIWFFSIIIHILQNQYVYDSTAL